MSDKRTPKPSHKKLVSDEEAACSLLFRALDKATNAHQDGDPAAIKSAISNLKASIKEFESTNRALSAWLSSKGSFLEASEVRNKRLELVHKDCREVLKNLNEVLASLNEDIASSIPAPSVSHQSWRPDEDGAQRSSPSPSRPAQQSPSVISSLQDFSAASSANSEHSPRNAVPFLQEDSPKDKVENYLTKGINQLDLQSAKNQKILPDEPDPERLDPISRRQLKQDLLRGSGDPFSGEPHRFWAWKHQLSRRIHEAEVGALDSLFIIEANTTGRPKKMVSSSIAAGSHEPTVTLGKVWKYLDRRFGNNALVSESLFKKLEEFPFIKSPSQVDKLEDFLDLCRIIDSTMSHCEDLAALNLPRGMKTVWMKLPEHFQRKLRHLTYEEEKKTGRTLNFKKFLQVLEEYVEEVSNPSFQTSAPALSKPSSSRNVRSLLTSSDTKPYCAYHKTPGHIIQDCRVFKGLPYPQRKQFASDNKLCFSCLGEHLASNCQSSASCEECKGRHILAMHRHPKTKELRGYHSNASHQTSGSSTTDIDAKTNCLEVCHERNASKICSKTVLVDVKHSDSSNTLRCLAIVDEQSNTTFCDPKLVDFFNLHSCKSQAYSLTTMSSFKTSVTGFVIDNLSVKGVTENKWIKLPRTVTNPNIPNSSHEAASPEVVSSHPHISHLAKNFPKIDKGAEVLLLIGADCGDGLYTKFYGKHFPYVQRSPFGWSLVGPICKRYDTSNKELKCFRTTSTVCEHFTSSPIFDKELISRNKCEENGDAIFVERPDDDLPGLSRLDEEFLNIMENNIKINGEGKLEMPLPLKKNLNLTDNKSAVFARTSNTLSRLKSDPIKLDKALNVMGKYIAESHIEEVPHQELNAHLTYYVPVFPVVHPKKKKLRIVFDSSASHRGVSLNDNLLQGPDYNNKIIGVLTRFRLGKVGFSADIHCMFHCFSLAPVHRDLLRFFWFKNNNPDAPLAEFRSRVHNFGNTSSPAVANFGLRYTTRFDVAQRHPDSCDLIKNNFYVDDCLASADNDIEAVDVLQHTVQILSKFSIKLHQIASNSEYVRSAFNEDRPDVVDIGEASLQKTLGVSWCTSTDNLIVKCEFPNKQITKRGVLSTLHSLYDPLGMASPVVLAGKLLQRQMFPRKGSTDPLSELGWDDELPRESSYPWVKWLSSLEDTASIAIPRCFVSQNFSSVVRREFHVFCDASDLAIGFVIYLRSVDQKDNVSVTFVIANSKLAPRAATSIPRLELCAALEGTRAYLHIKRELDIPIDEVRFYTDSRVTLGYINNENRRFSKYVANRVAAIRRISEPSQWNYVQTKCNPADIASRPQKPSDLLASNFLVGPEFLRAARLQPSDTSSIEVELPETCAATCLRTHMDHQETITDQVCKLTNDLVKAQRIITAVRRSCDKWLQKISKNNASSPDFNSLLFLIRQSQQVAFPGAHLKLERTSVLPENHELSSLCPFLDNEVIRVGGRLRHSQLHFGTKHPILLSSKHPISIMIVRYHHEKVYHQGRFLTSASLRQAGYHLHKAHVTIRKLINACFFCKKLRGKFLTQQMADLPRERLEESPPFTSTGLDTFGPYYIHDSRTTRNSKGTKKTWVLLLTCLVTRAVHLEPLTSLDSSTFNLALRSFLALRGQCKYICSDNGTNFLPSKQELTNNFDVNSVKDCVEQQGCTWKMIPPGASHQAGVWERKVGSIKRVLHAAMQLLGPRALERNEFYTLLKEAACIVNNTPLYEYTSDPNDHAAITPAMLLTLKDHPNPSPLENFTHEDIHSYGRKRWRRTQYLAEQFWIRWRSHFLSKITERKKWLHKTTNIKDGDLVLLRDKSPRNQWPTGRVHNIERSKDGLVRAATIRMATHSNSSRPSFLRRSIRDLILLEPSM